MPTATSVHEAAHAVVCHVLGGQVYRVVALEDEGEVRFRLKYEAPLSHHAAICVGGAVGEQIILGLQDARPSDWDMDLLTQRLCGSLKAERERTTRAGWGLARMLVKRNQRTVTALAKALDESTILQGARLQALLHSAHLRAPLTKR